MSSNHMSGTCPLLQWPRSGFVGQRLFPYLVISFGHVCWSLSFLLALMMAGIYM